MRTETIEILPVGGLSDTLSPAMIDDKDASVAQNCFTDDEGILKKVRGFHRIGRLPPQVVDACEIVWVARPNVTAALVPQISGEGVNAVRLTIASAFTTGLIATRDFPAINLSTFTKIAFSIRSDINLPAGVLQLLLDDSPACASPIEALSIGSLTAGVTSRQELTFASPLLLTAIISVGLRAVSAPGACNIIIDDIVCSHTCKRLYVYKRPDGSEILIGTDGVSLWRSVNARDWILMMTGLSRTHIMDGATYRGKCWLCNGFNPMVSLDSSNRLVDYGRSQIERPAMGGSATTLVDSANLTQPSGHWNGLPIMVRDADSIPTPNRPFYAVITDYVRETASIGPVTTIAFVRGSPDTITDTGNRFLTAGFVAGMLITVSGSPANSRTFEVASVVAGTITLTTVNVLVAEAAGASITITGTRGTLTFLNIGFVIVRNDLYTINGIPPPRGNVLETHQEKLFIAGQSEPSTIRFNDERLGAEEYLSWTAMGKTIELAANDGDRITAMRHYADDLIIFKRYNFWRLYGWVFTFAPDTMLTKSESGVGCLYDHGVVLKDGVLYWMADKGFYAMDATYRPQRISDNKIERLFDSLTKPRFDWAFWLQSTEADFLAGVRTNGIDLTSVPGDIRHGWLQTTTAEFNQGTLSGVNTANNEITLWQTEAHVPHNDTSANATAWNHWVEVGGTGNLVAHADQEATRFTFHVSVTGKLRRWRDDPDWGAIRIDLVNAAGAVVARSEQSVGRLTSHTFNVIWDIRSLIGAGNIYRVRRFVILERLRYGWRTHTNLLRIAWPAVGFLSGSLISQRYNTGITNPVWGVLRATTTGAVWWQTRVSADGITWDAWVDATLGSLIPSASRQWIQWRAILSGAGANVQDVTVYFDDNLLSQVRDTGIVNPIWITFGGEFDGGGQNVSFQMWVSSDGITWLDEDRREAFIGQRPTNASKRFLRWRVFLRTNAGVSGDIAVHNVVINWSRAEAATTSLIDSAIYDRRAYWAGTMRGRRYNDTLIVLDRNNNWQIQKGINVGALAFFHQNIHFGSSREGNSDIFIFDVGRNFGENPIDAFWVTKKFGGSLLERVKIARKYWLIANRGTGTLRLGYCPDDGLWKDFDIDLSGSGVYNRKGWFPAGVRYKFLRLRFANDLLNEGFEVKGLKVEQDICEAEVIS